MRHLYLTLLLSFYVLFGISDIHAQTDSIYVNTGYRSYKLHVPAGYIPGTQTPLVIALHGFLGWGAQLENQSDLSVKSDLEGFIVVYPDGEGTKLVSTSWNAGYCCSYAVNNNIDDVEFIRQLIDSLSAEYTINQDRIYATGMSNGALMCYRLACELSDKIAAIAPVAGTYMLDVACNPIRTVPVIHFHSYLDTDIPVPGGNGTTPPYYYFPPADSMINVFAGTSNCTVMQDTVYNGTDYDWFRWSPCNCFNEFDLYITHDGGHSWPGGNQTAFGDPPSTAISANDLMWDFFVQHPMSCLESGISENNSTSDVRIYPNPAVSKIIIKAPGNIESIELYSSGGVLESSSQVNATEKEYEISNLAPGVYYVKVIFSGDVQTVRFVHE